ncbi:hypothetical protein COOONC_05030 [Cooperia oncophora]
MAFHFIFLSCIIFLATVLGLFGNISLIYAVVRYKTLHSKTCHRLMPYPVYGVLVHIPCVCVATCFVIGGAVLMNDEVILVCNPPLALPDPVSEIWNLTTMIANAMALIVYALVVIQVFKLQSGQVAYCNEARIIVEFQTGIHLLKPGAIPQSITEEFCDRLPQLYPYQLFAAAGISRIPFTTDPEIRELIHTYAVIPPLFIMCQNYYIYFIMSSEYRYVFKAILGMRKNDVTTLSNARKTTLVAVSIM